MKDWKHLILEQRKVIASGIAHNYKLKDIGESLDFDPTSISKEVKRNRIEVSIGLKNNCKRTKRWPYVCTGCNKRYNNCPYTKYKYDAKKAQEKADINLVNSRRGIDITSEEFKQLDAIIKNGIDDNKSIYQIKIENNDKIKQCVSTLYGYINNGYLTTKRMDLPYAVTYKKRKHNKKYEYSDNNKIDRTGHTYLDYLAFLHKNPGIHVWQLDFLGSIKTDNNSILTFILPNLLARIEAVLRRCEWQKEAQQKSEKTLNKDVNIDLLTPKEKEVLLLVAQGASNQEIADKLFVRDVTIKTHLNSIFKKLKVTNRTQAVLLAMQMNLIN